MAIPTTEGGLLQHHWRQKLTKGHHNAQISPQLSQLRLHCQVTAYPFWAEQGNGMAQLLFQLQRPLLYRRRNQGAAPAPPPIRLGNHPHQLVTGFH
jgi:hypothetical protein